MCRFPTPEERILAIIETTDVRNEQSFAGMLHSAMEYLHLSNADAAIIFQTSPGTVSRWENGHTAPAIPTREVVKTLLRAAVEVYPFTSGAIK